MRSGMLVIAFVLFGLVAPAAQAEASQDAAWNAAYQQLLKTPSDKAINERYIALSIARGDYESAIPPLERLSMQSPNDMGYVLKLGDMYKNLQSKAVSNSYYNQVINSPKATPEQKAQAKQHIQ